MSSPILGQRRRELKGLAAESLPGDDLSHVCVCLQSLAELKRKISNKKRQWEEEMEELKQAHEVEVNQLRDKHRKEKTSTSVAASDQLALLEKELEEQWRTKCERQVSQTEDRWRRKNQDLREEMEGVRQMLADTQSRLEAMRQQDMVSQLHSTQQELEEVKGELFKVRTQLGEARITERKAQEAAEQGQKSLVEERSVLVRELEEARAAVASLKESEGKWREKLQNTEKSSVKTGSSPEVCFVYYLLLLMVIICLSVCVGSAGQGEVHHESVLPDSGQQV